MLSCFMILQFFTVLLSLDIKEEASPIPSGKRVEKYEQKRDPQEKLGDLDPNEMSNVKMGDLEANVVGNLEAGKERKNIPSGARAEEHGRILQQVFHHLVLEVP